MEAANGQKAFSKLQRALAGQTVKHVRDNQMALGTPFTETSLAELFGVSRSPIRAALEYLAIQGVVPFSPRRGFSLSRHPEASPAAMIEPDSKQDTPAAA